MFTRREFMAGTGAVLASSAFNPAWAATNLDLATVWPDGNFHTTNAKKFAEEVGKASALRATCPTNWFRKKRHGICMATRQ